MRLTPKSDSPPASPIRWRMRSAQGALNAWGYPAPLCDGAVLRSIFGTLALVSTYFQGS